MPSTLCRRFIAEDAFESVTCLTSNFNCQTITHRSLLVSRAFPLSQPTIFIVNRYMQGTEDLHSNQEYHLANLMNLGYSLLPLTEETISLLLFVIKYFH